MKIIDLADINPQTKTQFNDQEHISYLDTSNITKSSIDNIQSLIVGQDKIPSRARRKVLDNDIIYSTVRPKNKHFGFINDPLPNLLVSTGFVVIRVNPVKANQRFVYEYLTQDKFINHMQNIGEDSTSTYPGIKPEDLSSIEIELPSRKKQDFIGNLAAKIDKKIEINRQINKILEETAEAIFKSWFIDFDPVKRKMEGRSTGLQKKISDLFPDSFENTKIGMIPEGWRVLPVSEEFQINPKYSLKKNKAAPYIEMRCLSEKDMLIKEGYVRKFTSGKKFSLGDTLFARITPSLENGKSGLVTNLEKGEVGWGSTEFIVFSPNDSQSSLYPYLWARNKNLRSAAVEAMTGSDGRQRVPDDFFDFYLIASAPKKIQESFKSLTSQFLKKIVILSEEIKTLENIQNIVLPRLISGKIDILNIGE